MTRPAATDSAPEAVRETGPADAPAATLDYFVYLSTAAERFDDGRLHWLLERCRTLNAADGVTGVLLYSDRQFLQYLEGPSAALARVWTRIRSSRLHRNLLDLERGTIETRRYGQWFLWARPLSPDLVLKIERERFEASQRVADDAGAGRRPGVALMIDEFVRMARADELA